MLGDTWLWNLNTVVDVILLPRSRIRIGALSAEGGPQVVRVRQAWRCVRLARPLELSGMHGPDEPNVLTRLMSRQVFWAGAKSHRQATQDLQPAAAERHAQHAWPQGRTSRQHAHRHVSCSLTAATRC